MIESHPILSTIVALCVVGLLIALLKTYDVFGIRKRPINEGKIHPTDSTPQSHLEPTKAPAAAPVADKVEPKALSNPALSEPPAPQLPKKIQLGDSPTFFKSPGRGKLTLSTKHGVNGRLATIHACRDADLQFTAIK